MSSTDIARTRAAASSMARGRPSSRRTTLSTVSGSRATLGRAARARWPNSSDAASSPSWASGKTRSAAIANGARVVVTTRRRGQDATRKATRSATASTTCSQLSRMSRAGAPARVCAVRARTSLRCSGVRIRRPLTESRTPRAEPTSPTTSSAEATPTSSTKCTTGCSASWPSRCASRVLPSPPGPRIETTRDSRTSARRARMSSSRPIRDVDSWCRPDRTGLSAASSSACTAASAGPGSTPRRSARSLRTCAYRSSAAGLPCTAPRERSRAAAVSSSPTPASSRSGSASRWSPRADSDRPSTAPASARSRRASSRRAASGPSPPDAGAVPASARRAWSRAAIRSPRASAAAAATTSSRSVSASTAAASRPRR